MSKIDELAQAASVAMQKGETQVAGQLLTRLVNLAPQWAPGRVEFGMFLLRLGRQLEGVDQLKLACLCQPPFPNAFLAMGAVEHNRENFENARRLFMQALVVDPMHTDALRHLAGALTHSGKADWLVRLLSNHRTQTWINNDLRQFLARALNKTGEFERLRSVARCSVIISPSDPSMQGLLAHALLLSDEKERAFSQARRSIMIEPNGQEILRAFSNIAFYTGRFNLAVKTLEDLLEHDREDLSTQFWLGRVHYNLGNLEAAERFLTPISSHKDYRERVRILRMTAVGSDFELDEDSEML
jgi:tetratricopeptide (TPR) repeat protein